MYGLTLPFLFISIVYGPDVVVVNCWDRLCTLGRAPHTFYPIFVSGVGLPDIHEYSSS